MGYLIGCYNCKLDAKGRLMVPADFKEQLGNLADEGFVLRPRETDTKRCIEFYTKKGWNELLDKINSRIDHSDEDQLIAFMIFNNGAKPVKLDANGRIQIPKELMDLGILKKDVVLTTEINKMVIWDKEEYGNTIGNADKKKYKDIINTLIK